jgi:osmotically-inducible protein OsmY
MAKLMRTLQITFCIALISASLGYAADQKPESAGQYLDDSVITTRVKAAILNEPTLKTLQINVKTYKGTAQLSGFVDSAQSVDKAGQLAESVNGVQSVRNDLLIKK